MAKNAQGLHRFAVVTACATFLLLIAGSLVTSNDAGLAVPDWPLSYGTWFPPMVGGILYEHGHRMIAGAVGIMILMLAIRLARSEPRLWVRRLGFAALAAVFLQALLGGLTVLLLLPPQVSVSHACLGQAVFCLIVCLGLATGSHWQENLAPWRDAPPGIRQQGLAIGVCAGVQLLLGAVIRHTGSTAVWHIAGAGTLTMVAAVYSIRVGLFAQSPQSLRHFSLRLVFLIFVQLIAGALVYFHRSSVPLRTVHLGVGALVLAQAVVLAWQTTRFVPRRV